MSANVFLDTNIIVYSYSSSEPDKQSIARNLIATHTTFISTQVLQELINTVTRKFQFSFSDAARAAQECWQNNQLHINNADTILQACSIAAQYQFSFYDSLIIAAALQAGCSTLYSEDLHHNQVVLDTITIVNPFIK